MWSWGAGECGQLGSGRCTNREIATCCYRVDGSSKSSQEAFLGHDPVTTIACGYAHVIALTKSGELYTWGINKQGQLGLKDDVTRQAPTLMPENTFKHAIHNCQTKYPADADGIIVSNAADQYRIVRVFADLHSTAAVDAVGRLYTWGSVK